MEANEYQLAIKSYQDEMAAIKTDLSGDLQKFISSNSEVKQ